MENNRTETKRVHKQRNYASEEGITEIEKLQIENWKLKMHIDIKKVPRN